MPVPRAAAILAPLLVLGACHSKVPASCRTDPKGFECRMYHREVAQQARADRDAQAAKDFGSAKPKPPKKQRYKQYQPTNGNSF